MEGSVDVGALFRELGTQVVHGSKLRICVTDISFKTHKQSREMHYGIKENAQVHNISDNAVGLVVDTLWECLPTSPNVRESNA
jgi:hypothetical protein